MHWGNYGGIGFGSIFMLLFWILVIIGLLYFLKHLFGSKALDEKETAEDILKKRYAAGEITTDEFHQKRLLLRKNP